MILKKLLIFLGAASLVGLGQFFFFATPVIPSLEYSVFQIFQIPALESNWHYGLLMLFSFVPVFVLSFDKKVHYYTHWRSLVPGIILIALWFILWDVLFTLKGVWGFNPGYYGSISLFGLPIEECLFFIVVPFCCYFLFACLNAYLPTDKLIDWDKRISLGLGGIFILLGIVHLAKAYTGATFLLTGMFMIWHYYSFPNQVRTRLYRAYALCLIPFLLVDGSLTGLFTDQPVVLYNPEEFLKIRIGSIPIEDAVYGFLLVGLVTTAREGFEEFFKK
ncbi:MAG: lycopene cyclase domain-containing protein [Saprospiraceae bacterium]|nr:lycopene cyclase domain-containing protein [Saprospiraceae bacterium]